MSAPETQVVPPPAHTLRVAALVCAAYCAATELGFALTFRPYPGSPLWAPNAILLAAFLLTPVRAWRLLLLAVLPWHLALQLHAGVPLLMALCWFVSNACEALIGAALARHLTRGTPRLDRFAAVGILLACGVLAVVLSSFLDAGFVALNHFGESRYWTVWRTRVFSNILATTTVVPVILAWSRGGLAALRKAPPWRLLEVVVVAMAVMTVSLLVFGRHEAGQGATPALLYAPLPLLLWASVRFGPRGASTSVMAIVLVAIWFAVHGRGPFVARSPEANALSIQLLFAIVSVTLLSLTAVIEERSRVRDSARRKEEHLRLALDAARMITWEWPLSGETVVVSSKEAERRMGVAGEAKITLARLLETIHPTDRPAVWRAMALAIEQGSPYETEFRVIERDGSTAWALGRGKVLTDQAGRPELMIGLRADITERKRTEALIAGENRVLAMIATGAPLGDVLECVTCLVESESPGLLCSIVLLHEDGKHMRVGAAPSLPKSFASAIEAASVGPRSGACGTAMYRREAVISSDILVDPLWEGCRELASVHGLRACWSMPIISPREKLLGSFAIYSREPRVPKAAETRLIEIGTQLAAIAVERKRAERESHEQQRQVRHLSRAALLGELTGTLAHELNQPLSSILSNAQAGQRLFNREPIDVAELRAILADIVAAERRATDVIERVCSMLRKGQSAMALVDLNEVLCETLQLSNGDLLAREVTVETRLTRSLPPVMADRVQLQQVLLNLCVNAGDAMADAPTGQRRLTIATGCSSNGAAVELTVTDHGVGIPADQLDQVFEPFFTSKEHHLGLGLSICRSIARAHGGRLWAANNAEGGASFHVSLPAACATCTRGQAASGREPAQTTACGLPDRRCAVPAVGSGLLG